MSVVWVILLDGDVIAVGSDHDSTVDMVEDDADERGISPDDYAVTRVPLDTRTF